MIREGKEPTHELEIYSWGELADILGATSAIRPDGTVAIKNLETFCSQVLEDPQFQGLEEVDLAKLRRTAAWALEAIVHL